MHYTHIPTPTQQPTGEDFHNAREFVKDKLYFVSLTRKPQPTENVHYFTVDQQFVYTNFYADFGPSNMSHVVRFCYLMQDKFQNPATANKVLCLYTSYDIDKRANAAFLLCTYMVVVCRKTPEEAYQCLMGISPPFVPYRDAGYGPATYHITILDCVRGIHRALTLGLFDLENFDLEEYEFYEKVENGDYNWLTNKFVALAAPKDDLPGDMSFTGGVQRLTQMGKPLYSSYRMNGLIKWMLENNVKTIIRLNNKTYEKKKFIDNGIEHIELYFPDGSTPPDAILKRFLEICETRPGPIAVHCKAGLGRTGSLIAAYLMKHYRLTASEVISFLRIIRPGSVVGPQQNYLQAIQGKIWKLTPQTRLPQYISCWNGATFPNHLNRFGPIPNAVARLQNTNLMEAILKPGRDYNTKAEVQEFEEQLARERHMTTQDLQGLSIPVQPRKHLINQQNVRIK
ncbi:dual specificity protein phosphatase [Globomyces pollinis-pini]|nr:dual specificity protein phosphatase [Globomyces pollinis-pini]